ncbi:hypothetical protein CHS0354_015895 [Potamilus streckersoni]|uniref:Protein BCCIP homolog n=1 Tax=Potamilus streckersoni TaxID=2493646 RepID=A0AAE0SEB3_9BIVA|nr:hypothetical protein CHS0354_015895 [Potamilus streckersoni]
MAASKKKRVEEDMEDEQDRNEADIDDSEEDCMDSDGEEEEAIINEEVQVDFEARVPEDSDFHGIKNLLKQVFLKSHVDTSELTEVIISQNYIGSVVKQTIMPDDEEEEDDDDTVMAVTTVINITERQDLSCVKQLKAFLEQKCQECAKDQKEKWFKVLHNQDQQIGYLINERFINLPPNLAVPIFESLVKEMEKARQKKMKYDFNYFLMLCKSLKMTTTDDGTQQDIFFINSEEEIFRDASELNFSYSVAEEKAAVGKGGWSSEEDMDSFRTVLLIPAEKLDNIIQRIKDELAAT